MRAPSRSSGPNRSNAGKNDGSMLVEALIGIGMLGAIVGAVATILPVTLDATVRATAHRTALVVGESLLEADVAGIQDSIVPLLNISDELRVNPRISHDAVDRRSPDGWCDSDGISGAVRTSVRVQHGVSSDGRAVALQSGARPSSSVSEGHHLTLRWSGEGPVPDGLVVAASEGEVRLPSEVGPDCVGFSVAVGASWLTLAEEAPVLIDRMHVPLDERPHVVTLASGPHERLLDFERASWLRVHLDDGGARLPDDVERGALRWLVRGDDANVASDGGEARPVHPGPVTAVVPGCDDSSATGSSVTLELEPGEHRAVQIPLAVVTVEDVRGRDDVWLRVQRSTGCADGSPLRPWVLFKGGLHDGMRIALPRGEWDAWLEIPNRWPMTPSVRLLAVGEDTVVRLP